MGKKKGEAPQRKKNGKRFKSGDPILDSYLEEIADTEPLNSDQEAVLAERIRQGDSEALNQLVEANLRFVVSVAKDHQHRGVSLPELISAGNIGLITAANRFDEKKGFKFISYAVWWIRQAMLQAIMEQNTVHMPANRLNLQAKISRAYDCLQKGHSALMVEEISQKLGVPEKKINELLALPESICSSLDAPLSDGEEATLLDRLRDERQLSPEEELLKDSVRDDINIVLSLLSNREAEILKLYFGLGQESSKTLAEIGDHFGLTRERVRQIKEQALAKLRRPSVYANFH